MNKTVVLLMAALFLLAACRSKAVQENVTSIAVNGGSYYEVDAQQLSGMLENKDFVLVNVHIPFEGNIPATDLSIPYDQVEQHLGQLPADKDAKIFLYCRSDGMSHIAAAELVSLGYTNVWHLAGGFVGWKQAGYAFEE